MLNTPSQSQQHQMQLAKTQPSVGEEWYCPICGRRFLIHWPPNYKKVILEAGDEYAIHSGGKGGLQMGPVRLDDQPQPDMSPELRAELEEILADIDFDNWPDQLSSGP